jgi:16S rRNA (uracil1498-N3)-methyltransferase
VLRLGDGDVVTVTDGRGGWRSTLLRVVGREVALEPHGSVERERRVDDELVLATAIPKGERVDWLVQKVAEVGADRIVLLHASRSVVRWAPERADRRRARLQRIADEALQQSRRVWRTVVDGPVAADEVLPEAALAEPGGRPPAAADRVLAIGPEGGWTDDELARAGERIDLGPAVLRVETAAVVAATLVAAARRGSGA